MSDIENKNADGRDASGRFGAGNKCGKGNPFATAAQRIRAALFRSIKPRDIEAAVAALVKKAKNGDRQALRELLDRVLGTPAQSDLLERVEELERLSEKFNNESEQPQ